MVIPSRVISQTIYYCADLGCEMRIRMPNLHKQIRHANAHFAALSKRLYKAMYLCLVHN